MVSFLTGKSKVTPKVTLMKQIDVNRFIFLHKNSSRDESHTAISIHILLKISIKHTNLRNFMIPLSTQPISLNAMIIGKNIKYNNNFNINFSS